MALAMNGHSSGAINVSRGCVSPSERNRLTYSLACTAKRSCKSKINVVSGLFCMKVKTREIEEIKRCNLISTCFTVRGSYSDRDSSSLKQLCNISKPLGLPDLRIQSSSASKKQGVFNGMSTNSSVTVNKNVVGSRIKDKNVQPPKVCTLREFRDGGEGVINAEPDDMSNFFETLAANVEALVQVRKFETLSGRFAMVAFAFALGMEYVTGNSVFKGIDSHKLGEIAALCVIATVSAGGFAIAWGAKAQISMFMSRGYQNFLDSTLDTIVDGLFYDDS